MLDWFHLLPSVVASVGTALARGVQTMDMPAFLKAVFRRIGSWLLPLATVST